MKAFAMQVRVGRLDNEHCSFGGGGARLRLSLWICVSLMMCSLLLCRSGSNVAGADPSLEKQLLLKFAGANVENQGECEADFASWNAGDVTPCGWLRVSCTPDSSVHRLDFSGCSLATGFQLDFLSDLGSLEELDLSSNPAIEDAFRYSASLALFPALTWLDVSASWSSTLRASLPELSPADFPVDFSRFPSLQYLSAERGIDRGGIPTTLVTLRELVYLSLADSGLEGGIPDEVGSLTQLVSLDLSASRTEKMN